MSPLRIILWIWIVWLAGWLLAAGWSARTPRAPGGLSMLAHRIPILLGGALFFVRPSPGSILEYQLSPETTWLPWLGLVMTLVGMAFAVWARITLGRMWSGRITLKEDHALIRTGPYALARHPIYTGLLIALLGTALARGTLNFAMGFALVTVSLILKLRFEEQLMTGQFGAEYLRYQQSVKGLIPFIW